MLVIASSMSRSVGLGLALSNAAVSPVRKLVPSEIRIPVFTLLIAIWVSAIDMILAAPNPILLRNIVDFRIMSKAWAEKNKTVNAQDYKAKEENYASRNANGTGPFKLDVGIDALVAAGADAYELELAGVPGWAPDLGGYDLFARGPWADTKETSE